MLGLHFYECAQVEESYANRSDLLQKNMFTFSISLRSTDASVIRVSCPYKYVAILVIQDILSICWLED